uniref:Uncharacterized protein n=1 Tax=viral metagenome TaxID=1070528 RepID=A0A6C0AGE9_9ZZZZ
MHEKFKGFFYNISKLASENPDADNYGANSTINYIGAEFRNLTSRQKLFETVTVHPDDFIIIKIKLDNHFKNNSSLFNFTPYFFTYGCNQNNEVFASVDQTLLFFDKQVYDREIKICCTANKDIAEKFKNRGYIISRIPIEYISCAKYTFLFRTGTLISGDFLNLPNNSSIDYYRSNKTCYEKEKYFNQASIIKKWTVSLKPLSFRRISSLFKTFTNDLTNLFPNKYLTYNYLSNIYSTNYPFQSFYDAISIISNGLNAQMQANNTGENYFNSNTINVENDMTMGFLVVSLNQLKFTAALTSNIQIYNMTNKSAIESYDTAKNLPSMNSCNYPYNEKRDDNYPVINCKLFSNEFFISKNVNQIMFVERLSYNPVNFNHTDNPYIDSAQIFYGKIVDLKKYVTD